MRNNKKVIGINGSFIRKPASGMGQVSLHFIKTLIKNNNSRVDYVIYLEEKVPQEIIINSLPENVKFTVVKNWYKRDDLIGKVLWERLILPAQVKRDDCDELISLYQSATVLRRGARHIMFVHDVVPRVFPEYLNNTRKKIYYKLIDRAVRKADEIMTVSEFSKREISKIYPAQAGGVSVANIACDPIFRDKLSAKEMAGSLKKYDITSDEKFIFYVGGFDVRKNVERLIKVYGKVASQKKDMPKLVLGGTFHKQLVPLVTDVEKIIKEVVSNHKINANMFKMVGFIAQEDLPAFYQSAELFVYPSLYEGFGMPILEAMVSGCLVLTSKVASIPEVISDDAGYLVSNPREVSEIEIVLQEALSEGTEKKEQKVSLALAESEKFSWEKFVETVLKNVE